VLDGGGDYVMVVKDNQPNLAEAIGTVFTAPPPAARRPGGRRRSTAAATAATRPVP